MREVHIAAGSTGCRFDFCHRRLVLYLVLTTFSGAVLRGASKSSVAAQGERRR